MEYFSAYIIWFFAGVICARLWSYIYGLGVSTIIVKTTINDCLKMMIKNVETLYEIHQLKYMALEMADRSEKFIEFQKRIDKHELNSMKTTIIRNFINPIHPRYNHLVPFTDWDGAMDYLNQQIQKQKGNEK